MLSLHELAKKARHDVALRLWFEEHTDPSEAWRTCPNGVWMEKLLINAAPSLEIRDKLRRARHRWEDRATQAVSNACLSDEQRTRVNASMPRGNIAGDPSMPSSACSVSAIGMLANFAFQERLPSAMGVKSWQDYTRLRIDAMNKAEEEELIRIADDIRDEIPEWPGGEEG